MSELLAFTTASNASYESNKYFYFKEFEEGYPGNV